MNIFFTDACGSHAIGRQLLECGGRARNERRHRFWNDGRKAAGGARTSHPPPAPPPKSVLKYPRQSLFSLSCSCSCSEACAGSGEQEQDKDGGRIHPGDFDCPNRESSPEARSRSATALHSSLLNQKPTMKSPRKTRKDTKTKGCDFLVTHPSGEPTICHNPLSFRAFRVFRGPQSRF